MLDAVVDYMPSPLDIPRSPVSCRSRARVERVASDDAFSALAFKIATDPFVGKLCFFRVYSGTLKTGSYVLNATKGKREVSGASFRCTPMTAPSSLRYSGDIAAAVGLKETATGDTLCTSRPRLSWSRWTFRNRLSRSRSTEVESQSGQDDPRAGQAVGRRSDVPHALMPKQVRP